MKKRGQISLFVILGIVVLIVGAIFIYTRSERIEKEFEAATIPALTEMPFELRPLRIYTEDCIEDISEDAFRKLGDRGGYIFPEELGAAFNPIAPTESDGLEFSPGSSLKIPYWWYLKSSNTCAGDCEFTSLRPPLFRTTGAQTDFSIESQIDSYVNSQLQDCLDGYAPFIGQGFTVEEGEVDTATFVKDEDIEIFVNFPISIKKGEVTYNIDRFFVSLPLNIKRIYNFATEITNKEINYSFFESQALNMITAYASLDSDKLPPKTEATFDFAGGTTWSKTKVKENIASMLMNYIGAIQAPFTLNYEPREFPEDSVKTALYATDAPVNLGRDYDDLLTRFDYLGWWPIYFDLNCEGDICKATSANNPVLSFIGYQQYDFVYDISFPVVISIEDPSAFFGSGYSFKFAIEANIRNNEPIDKDFPGYEGAYISTQPFMCDEDMRGSGEIEVASIDQLTKKGLKDVIIMYTCGDHSCEIGKTGTDGKIISKFPVCFGGIVSFITPDYLIPSRYLDTYLDRKDFVISSGYPFVDKDFKAMKWVFDLDQNSLGSFSVDLDAEEKLMLSLEKIPDSIGENVLTVASELQGTETSQLLNLVPGKYKVNGNMLLYQEVVIPEEKRDTGVGVWGDLLGADTNIVIPKIEFKDGYPSGGVVLNEKTGYIELSPDDLYSSEQITFYVIGSSLPKKVEDLEKVQGLESLSSRFREVLHPSFEK